MIDIAAIKADPRRKALAILSGVTALFVVLATLALMQRGGETAIKYAPRLLFPGLQQQLDMLAEIDIKIGRAHV